MRSRALLQPFMPQVSTPEPPDLSLQALQDEIISQEIPMNSLSVLSASELHHCMSTLLPG